MKFVDSASVRVEAGKGGSVAAPVFKNIGRETLRYLNVPSNDQRVYILDRA